MTIPAPASLDEVCANPNRYVNPLMGDAVVPWQEPSPALGIDQWVTKRIGASHRPLPARDILQGRGVGCPYRHARIILGLAVQHACRARRQDSEVAARAEHLNTIRTVAQRCRDDLATLKKEIPHLNLRAGKFEIGFLDDLSLVNRNLERTNRLSETFRLAEEHLEASFHEIVHLTDDVEQSFDLSRSFDEVWKIAFALQMGTYWHDIYNESPPRKNKSLFVKLIAAGASTVTSEVFKWDRAVQSAIDLSAAAQPWQRMDRYVTGAERPVCETMVVSREEERRARLRAAARADDEMNAFVDECERLLLVGDLPAPITKVRLEDGIAAARRGLPSDRLVIVNLILDLQQAGLVT